LIARTRCVVDASATVYSENGGSPRSGPATNDY
jgi:hypothetical protein